tara:strand:- start:1274 stop:1483 length:210 start_codon:yes stop_codon:yes gene_type:complete
MNNKELMLSISKQAEFLDELVKDLKIHIIEDERDADKMTDGTGDILEGRVEMARLILIRIENFLGYKKY